MTVAASAEPLVASFLDGTDAGELVPGVPTIGHPGKPIHVLAGISPDAVLTGAKLIKHSEAIVLVCIPEGGIRGAPYCTVRIAGGLHRAAIIDFVRDPSVGGCAVALPPDHPGFRLAREPKGRSGDHFTTVNKKSQKLL